MAFPKLKISDNDGNVVSILKATDADDPDLDGQYLLGTHALVAGRLSSIASVDITAYPNSGSTYKGLCVTLTDGYNIAGCNAANQLEVSIENTSYEDADDASTTPKILLTGGVYRDSASPTTYEDNDAAVLQTDINGNLKTVHAITGMVSEVNDDVDTTVEDLRVAGDTACKRVDMMADPANTGYIWVGDSSVANDGTGGGIRLSAGDFYSIDTDMVNDIHVAATVADQKIMYTYYT